MEYRSMRTAPRDGTRVLLLADEAEWEGPDRVMIGAYQNDGMHGWETDREWWPDRVFTGWMPLEELLP